MSAESRVAEAGAPDVATCATMVEPAVTLVPVAPLVFQFDWELGKEGRSDVVDESGVAS